MAEFVVFDFDHTIVDDNTDYKFIDMDENSVKLLRERKEKGYGWSYVMSTVLSNLHSRGFRKEDVEQTLLQIPFVQGMLSFIHYLKGRWRKESSQVYLFILSHSNTYFITTLLRAVGCDQFFAKIFSFPGNWTPDGRLVVTPYSERKEECDFCPPDCCKGKVLSDEIKSFVVHEEARMYYIGDGKNDFCAALNLTDKDYILYREGFVLEKYVKKHGSGARAKDGRQLKAKSLSWNSGVDLLRLFETL